MTSSARTYLCLVGLKRPLLEPHADDVVLLLKDLHPGVDILLELFRMLYEVVDHVL